MAGSGAGGRRPRRGARSWLRAFFAGAAASAILLVGASPALAHARLVTSEPSQGRVLPGAPTTVAARFTEVVDSAGSSVTLVGPDGRAVADVVARRDPADATRLVATVPGRLSRGTWTVRWTVLSLDGHVVRPASRFAVGTPSAPLTKPAAPAVGPTPAAAVGRAASDCGLLCLAGLLAFGPLTVRPALARLDGADAGLLRQAVRSRLLPWQLGAALLATAGSVLTLLDSSGAGNGSSLSFLGGTRTGHLLAVRLLALAVLTVGIAAAAVLGRRTGDRHRPALDAALAVTAGLALLTVAASSHAAGGADAPLAVLTAWTHLVAAGIWTGGLLALAVAGLAAARAMLAEDRSGAVSTAAALAGSFATGAQVCVLAVAGTGLYAALVHLDGVTGLTGSAWGVELAVKLGLLATALLLAAANSVSVVPRLSARASSLTARLAACGDLASAVRLEIALVVVLVGVAAVLAGTAPPDQLG